MGKKNFNPRILLIDEPEIAFFRLKFQCVQICKKKIGLGQL